MNLPTDIKAIVIDISNVVRERHGLGNENYNDLRIMNKKCLDLWPNAKMFLVADSDLRHIFNDEPDYQECLQKRIILQSKVGCKADTRILNHALKHQGYIITNDKYEEYIAEFSSIFREGRFIRYYFDEDEVILEALEYNPYLGAIDRLFNKQTGFDIEIAGNQVAISDWEVIEDPLADILEPSLQEATLVVDWIILKDTDKSEDGQTATDDGNAADWVIIDPKQEDHI